MTNKKIKKILIAIIIIAMTTKTIYAYTIGFGSYTPSGGGGASTGTPNTKPCQSNIDFYNKFGWCPKGGTGDEDSGYEYECKYTYDTYNKKTNITIDSYNMEGTPLLLNSISTEGWNFSSGTWIGISNKEEKEITWEVGRLEYFKKTYDYTCIYSKTTITTSKTCVKEHNSSKCKKGEYVTKTVNKDLSPQGNKPSCVAACSNIEASFKSYKAANKTCICEKKTTTFQCNEYEKECVDWDYSKNEKTVYSPEYTVNQQKKDYTCPKAPFTINGVEYDKLYQQNKKENLIKENNPPSKIINMCQSTSCDSAEGEAINYLKYSTSIVRIINTNNYPTGGIKENNTSILNSIPDDIKGLKCKEYPATKSATLTRIFRYMPKHVCMNAITGDIRYIIDGNETCKNDIEIPNGKYSNDIYWRYFIPLDTKSYSDFYIKVEKSSNVDLDVNECKSVVENYPIKNDYTYKIQKLDGSNFTGPVKYDKEYVKNLDGYYGCKSNTKSLSKNECYEIMDKNPQNNDYTNYISGIHDEDFVGDYDIKHDEKSYSDKTKIEQDKGCKLATKVNFSVNQEFYGEKSNNNALKGYGMYFRQIDINNPFPNGLNKESYWYGLYNSGKVNGKELTTSFGNKSTYVANITNSAANAIRKYNNDTPYTKWVRDNITRNGMNANGTSDFIRFNNDTNSIFDKKAPTNSFYKLGCGPTNIDWSWCKS